MKLIAKYKIWALFLVIPFFSNCADYLDKDPLAEFAGGAFWSNENNATLALTGVYKGNISFGVEYQPYDWWSYHGLYGLEMCTDNTYDRRDAAFLILTNGTLTNTNAFIGYYWEYSYKRIARCCDFLENVGKVSMSEEKMNRMKAEAQFIRACQYFYMSQFYGSVPLVTKTMTIEEANNVTKASKADLVRFVIDELTDAIKYLPQQKDLPAKERGRATKQAALAFLGRIQMAEGKWNDAASTYKTIIDYKDNIIDPVYRSLFNGTNESSKEIIFAAQHLETLANNSMQQHFGPNMLSGWCLNNPLGSLFEAYEFTDGTPFSYTNPLYDKTDLAKNRDPRLKHTLMYDGCTFKGQVYKSNPDAPALDRINAGGQTTRTGFIPAKITSEFQSVADLSISGIDMPIIRYAEVLLSYLESKLESGATIDQALLDETINAVRNRTDVKMPAVTEKDPAKLREILRRERRVELAMEGIRLWDLFRWKTAHIALNGDFYGSPFPNTDDSKIRKKSGVAADPYKRWYVTSKAFRNPQDYTWPIPLAQQNINPNLRDN